MTNSKYLAPPDSPCVLQNPDGLPLARLIEETLPLPVESASTSVAISGTEENGYSPIYRNNMSPASLKHCLLPELNTYARLVDYALETFAEKPSIAYRKYDYKTKQSEQQFTTLSYRQVGSIRDAFGSGLLYLLANNPFKRADVFDSHRKIDNHTRDFKTYNKDKLSFILTLYSPNRIEWVITDLTCTNFAITNTALYDTLGPQASSYILSLTETPVVVASKSCVEKLIQYKEKQPDVLGNLIMIISMDPVSSDDFNDLAIKKRARKASIELYDFEQVVQIGHLFPHSPLSPTEDSVYTLSFTSGTTGANPKGVIIPHSMTTAGATYALTHLPRTPDAKSFSFLPLAHIFERQMFSWIFLIGGCVGFPQYNGSPLTLVEDLKIYKPTQLANVPRIYTKFEAGIKSVTIDSDNALKRNFFESVFDSQIKTQTEKDGVLASSLLYDKLYLPSIRKLFGIDNLKFFLSGSAPISVNTVNFLKAAFKAGFIEGFGLTESFAAISASIPLQANPGSVGSIGITTEMRLRELPAMDYTLQDDGGPRGELLLRGTQIFPGYYKDKKQTDDALSSDGWFSTGDVARIDSETGRLYIIDRVKNFFKLGQGEYVSPEKVENVYLSSNSMLTQCFAYGLSTENFLVAVVGVDANGIKNFLITKCKVPKSSLTSTEQVIKAINQIDNRTILLQFLNANVSAKGILQGFEKIHNIFIDIEPLRPDREVVTTTMKLKRPIAAKFFRSEIARMYKEGSLVPKAKI